MDQPLHQQQRQTMPAAAGDGDEAAATAEVRVSEDSKLVGVSVAVAGDADVPERRDSCCVAGPEVAVAADITVLKRKRGRPAKGAPKMTTLPPPSRQKKEEEDVCFICFDGGSLVLCDRRGCPKAYHPACIKRDDAFFRSKAKWNCGWHICSVCQKTSHYMCYTCTYSLCKGCTRDSDYVAVRANQGLCGLCMRTIMLIENPVQGDKPTCEVDFDDKTSWEYLFKVYWVCLKEKLGLTMDELLQAKSPWKRAAPVSCKVETPRDLYHLKDDRGSGSENSCIDIESNSLTNKKPKRRVYKQTSIWDGVSNDVGYSRQDFPVIGNMCIMKNQINPSDVVVGGSSNLGVVKSEPSGVALNTLPFLYSSGMEQPFNGFLNDKSWHYLDPTGKAQGPFSMLQLYKWNESRLFPPDLRIWRADEKQDSSVLLTDALNGKSSKNMSLPYNSQPQSLGSCVTLDHTNNIQLDGRNETKTEIHTDNQIIMHSGVVRVNDTCTQSNGKNESVRSNVLHSHSSSWTMAANRNNNEGQSGNFERREESSKCEISCHDQPPQSLALFFELNENPPDILREAHRNEGNSEDNGNQGSNRTPEGQSNSGQSCQKPSDSEENSGQSSGQNWECPQPQVIHPTCSTSVWQAIFGEPTDFSSIVDVDESVSDLLAEVEAMESLGGGGGGGGLESPTSIMKTDGSKNDSIEFALGLSPMLGVGKGDSLSSTADLHLPPQSTAVQEPFRQPDVHHLQRIHADHSSRSSEVESTFSRISWNPTNQFPWDPKC